MCIIRCKSYTKLWQYRLTKYQTGAWEPTEPLHRSAKHSHKHRLFVWSTVSCACKLAMNAADDRLLLRGSKKNVSLITKTATVEVKKCFLSKLFHFNHQNSLPFRFVLFTWFSPFPFCPQSTCVRVREKTGEQSHTAKQWTYFLPISWCLNVRKGDLEQEWTVLFWNGQTLFYHYRSGMKIILETILWLLL